MKSIRRTVAAVCAATLAASVITVSAYDVETVSGDLRWDFVTDSEGFQPKSNASIVGVSGGALQLTASGNDPNITAANIEIKTDEHRYLRFRVKNSSPSSMIQAYFYYASPWQCFNVNKIDVTANSNDFKEYEVDLYDIANSAVIQNYTDKETYPNLRFDFMNNAAGSTVELDYIVLSSNSMNDNNQNLVSSVTVGDMQVGEFDSSSDYLEVDLYQDIYDTLSAEDVFAETDGEIAKVNIKNVTDRKIIDIVAVSADGSYTNTYRIVCKAVKRPADPTDIEISKCEINGKTISVAGTLSSGDSRRMTILAHEKDSGYTGGEILYIAKLKTNEDGSFEKTFTLYDDENVSKLYNIELVFDVDGEEEPMCEYVYYVNNAKLSESLDQLKTSSDSVIEYMNSDENKIIYVGAGAWLDKYESQTADVKGKIDKAADKYKNELTAENSVRIVNGSIMSVLVDTLSDAKAVELTSEYDSRVYRLETEEKSFSQLDDDAKKRIITNLKSQYSGKLEDWKMFEYAVRENMLLDVVNSAPYTSLEQILLRNTDILKDDMKLLSSQTNQKLIDEAMKIVAKTARSSGFKTADALVKSVETSLKAASGSTSGNNTANNNTGTGNGGGGGGTIKLPAQKPTATQQPTGQNTGTADKVTFTDISGYDWAADAVKTLCGKGVISGVSADKFEPGRAITREEFVKLICTAFGLGKSEDLSTASSFSDVKSEDWFAPYVAKAAELGIVNGTADGKFGTGESIKREDMVTILSRAMEKVKNIYVGNGKSAADSFDDYAAVPDYAKSAVDAFAEAGIVNGRGDGSFGVGQFTNRAEAAVIMKRCMDRF